LPGWEEGNGIDVCLVASEGLDGLSGSHVPQFRELVASPGDEGVLVGREGYAHHVTGVIEELLHLRTRLRVPKNAGVVPRSGDDAFVVNETTAGEVAGVSVELTRHSNGNLFGAQVVNGANIVQASARHETAGWGVGQVITQELLKGMA